jgi:hypothetical protein
MLAISGIVILQAVYRTGKDCGTALTRGYRFIVIKQID